MNVLLDTNVLLDFVLEREPYVNDAELVFEAAKHHSIQLFMSATTITDVFYIARKEKGKKQTLELIEDLLLFVEVASVDKAVILHALHAELPDFEDAVQEGAAKQASISTIVTRNEVDFKQSDLAIYHPKEFVTLYGKAAHDLSHEPIREATTELEGDDTITNNIDRGDISTNQDKNQL